MRYEGWDVILFANTSAAPTQEFKTTCFESLDQNGNEISTVRSFISTVAPTTPFRISLHNWELPYSPSVLIKSRRASGEKIALLVEVSVDGDRVFREIFDPACKWPQEIAHEHRSLRPPKQAASVTSETSPRLRFPTFNTEVLMHKSWNTRSQSNAIIVTLAEQIVRKSTHCTEEDLGSTNIIASFAFQYAPRGILEQAGIAYPIRNPLYLPFEHERTMSSRMPQSFSVQPQHAGITPGLPIQISPETGTVFGQVPHSDLRQKPHQQAPTPTIVNQRSDGGHTAMYEGLPRSFIGIDEDVSMSTWPAAQNVFGFAANSGMSGYPYMHTRQMNSVPTWAHGAQQSMNQMSPGRNSHRVHQGKEGSNTTAFDNELLVNISSPSKKSKEHLHGLNHRRPGQRNRRPMTAQTSTPTLVRPPLASQGRAASYASMYDVSKVPSLERGKFAPPATNQPHYASFSSDKENRDPSQSWFPVPPHQATLAPTTNMFAQGVAGWARTAQMSNTPSHFPSMYGVDQGKSQLSSGKPSSAHAPSGFGGIKSRKEGLMSESSQLLDHNIRHDPSLLPSTGCGSLDSQKHDVNSSDRASNHTPASQSVEVIDVDAIDPKTPHETEKLPYFKPSHKSGMSSIDSTARLERTLYSALGEELASFGQPMDTTNMGPELAQALTGTAVHSEYDKTLTSPGDGDSDSSIKRKRQDTVSGGCDSRSTNKKGKTEQTEVEAGGINTSMTR